MESAVNIRTQPAVAAFDPTDHLTDYGLKVANPAALDAARNVVDALVKEAMAAIDAYFDGMKTLGQNPYREKLSLDDKELRFAAPVSIFADKRVPTSIDDAFRLLTTPRPTPAIFGKIERDLALRLKEYGFEIVAVERHRDGAPARIAVRDPVYAAKAEELRPRQSVAPHVNLDAGLDTLEGKGNASAVQHIVGLHRAGEATQWLDDFALQAVATVSEALQRAVTEGRTPFEDWNGYYKVAHTALVTRSRVRRDSDGDFRVPRRAVIAIAEESEVVQRFLKEFGSQGTASTDLRTILRGAVAARLKQRPDLRAAVVVSTDHPWNGRSSTCIAVVCGAELTFAPHRWLKKLVGLFTPKPRLLALPPPAAKPAALPPPKAEPVVVPPVGLPKIFETEVRQ